MDFFLSEGLYTAYEQGERLGSFLKRMLCKFPYHILQSVALNSVEWECKLHYPTRKLLGLFLTLIITNHNSTLDDCKAFDDESSIELKYWQGF